MSKAMTDLPFYAILTLFVAFRRLSKLYFPYLLCKAGLTVLQYSDDELH